MSDEELEHQKRQIQRMIQYYYDKDIPEAVRFVAEPEETDDGNEEA